MGTKVLPITNEGAGTVAVCVWGAEAASAALQARGYRAEEGCLAKEVPWHQADAEVAAIRELIPDAEIGDGSAPGDPGPDGMFGLTAWGPPGPGYEG